MKIFNEFACKYALFHRYERAYFLIANAVSFPKLFYVYLCISTSKGRFAHSLIVVVTLYERYF